VPLPSPRPISASPDTVITNCRRGALCQSLKWPGLRGAKDHALRRQERGKFGMGGEVEFFEMGLSIGTSI